LIYNNKLDFLNYEGFRLDIRKSTLQDLFVFAIPKLLVFEVSNKGIAVFAQDDFFFLVQVIFSELLRVESAEFIELIVE